jgi:sterol desaturase/sphingolipid hydroxylase (fatty acid hydroxylase superfamily)
MEIRMLLVTLMVLAVAERLPAIRFVPSPFARRYFGTDAFCLLTGAVGLGLALRAGAVAWAAKVPLSASPTIVLAAIVFYDLGGYVSHWLLHRFEPLWRIHKVHHSSRTLDWLATFRAHFLEHALRHVASPVVLILVGFPPVVVGLAGAIYASWAAFLHSNLRLGLRFLEPVLITPRLHRLHHVPATSERNLGTVFTLWDRLRGSLSESLAAPLGPIGVPGEIDTYPQRWLEQLVEPFRNRIEERASKGYAMRRPRRSVSSRS